MATASSLRWEVVEPVFAGIDPDTWCLDPTKIESAISAHTRAIVPVHVFGNACDVEAIGDIARRRDIKVIYDAAHAFGVDYGGSSLLAFGDAATLSFMSPSCSTRSRVGGSCFTEQKIWNGASR